MLIHVHARSVSVRHSSRRRPISADGGGLANTSIPSHRARPFVPAGAATNFPA